MSTVLEETAVFPADMFQHLQIVPKPEQPEPPARPWTTEHELAFIADLGVHGSGPHAHVTHGKSKAELLAGYLAGARQRKDWGKIDKYQAIAKAESLLRYHHGKESEEKNGISQ